MNARDPQGRAPRLPSRDAACIRAEQRCQPYCTLSRSHHLHSSIWLTRQNLVAKAKMALQQCDMDVLYYIMRGKMMKSSITCPSDKTVDCAADAWIPGECSAPCRSKSPCVHGNAVRCQPEHPFLCHLHRHGTGPHSRRLSWVYAPATAGGLVTRSHPSLQLSLAP